MTSRRGRTLQTDVSRILKATGAALTDQKTKPALILTVGLPGSGKSTFSRRLAPEIDAVILESDALRRLLFGEPSYTPAESRRLFAALHAAARELLLLGRTVIVDATSILEADRRPVYRLAEATGSRLHILHFIAPKDVIEVRLARRRCGDDPSDLSAAGLGVYRMMAEREQPLLREHWQIDTSDQGQTDSALRSVAAACRRPLQATAGSPGLGGESP